jgi:hypothetical protein
VENRARDRDVTRECDAACLAHGDARLDGLVHAAPHADPHALRIDDMTSRPTAGDQLLHHVEALFRAMERRDTMRVVWLLGDPLAVHLPREVIEEVIALSRSPRDSLRAPMHLLRYYHRTAQLLHGSAAHADPSQLAFELDDAAQGRALAVR